MNGIFIVLEGPDGSGKSTMAKMIGDYYESKGKNIIFTREPGGTKISEKIRDIILDNDNVEMANETEALLYAASRAQHVHEKIIPNLKMGNVVISERFVYSSLVYQGIGRNLGVDRVNMINDFAINGLKPDLVLFFDIDPKKALMRKVAGEEADRLENEDISFHQNVFEGYKKLIESYDEIISIDADKSAENLFQDICTYISKIE